MRPPWKPVLEHAIHANASERAAQYVQLATVKPNGRPSNRTLVFRGFFPVPDIDLDLLPTPTPSMTNLSSGGSSTNIDHSIPAPISRSSSDSFRQWGSSSSLHASRGETLAAVKLNTLLEFVADIRSAKIGEEWSAGKVAHAEVCWYFPQTREQFRLAGTLHMLAPPNSPLVQSVLPPWAPKDVDWEAERLRLWREISPSLRASFSWGPPGRPFVEGEQLSKLECMLPAEVAPSALTADATAAGQDGVVNLTVSSPSPQHPAPHTVAQSRSTKEQQLIKIHDEALSHFGILLLDVEFVDHLDLKTVPQTRMHYKVRVPERTWGRISGLDWESKRVFS
ncbi:pyridoxamine 5'-phosphate oxidase-domain-containing protein [Cladochytrium replicatum]|nr:pyridoxamine 5'-phosphate oxidase-domain-containing protein [Cladochytrium replicatum]